jgi:DNA-binding response OmpR family regulator
MTSVSLPLRFAGPPERGKELTPRRSTIIEDVRRFEKDIEAITVVAFIVHLRATIDPGHQRKVIETVRGSGYSIA